MSGLPPKAAAERTSVDVSNVPIGSVSYGSYSFAEHLKAIRTSLEVIAKATRDTADGLCYQLQIMISTDETKKLLERAP